MINNEIFALVRPQVDIHTLGLTSVKQLLNDCGYIVFIGDANIADCINTISLLDSSTFLKKWILTNKITRIGFSYRLDPKDGQYLFGKFYNFLKSEKLLTEDGGNINQVFFAGLPKTAELIEKEYCGKILTFIGDETPLETLNKLEIPKERIKKEIIESGKSDKFRFDFAKEIIYKGDYNFYIPKKNNCYQNYGTKNDSIDERLLNHRKVSNLPLLRVHVGPYSVNKIEALNEFKHWLKILSDTNFLDIVSVGSSQLSQSNFGENWEGLKNGGGVPINSKDDLLEIYEASRPMLIRTYSGTNKTQELAELYEETINISWHALSFWWFNKMDGRGPHDVKTNLHNHLETLKIIAKHNKPFEPNIPHHFSFRGGDDVTYVLSSYLACITAKKFGVKKVVLQTMMNTPKSTWGIKDLAKARALLFLVKELEDDNFKVFLQPRAGLDYFSPNLEKAKIQLSSVSTLIDDIEPDNNQSPDIIHVVSYSEAVELANPSIINESIQITLKSIEEHRLFKKNNPEYIIQLNNEVKPHFDYLFNTIKEIKTILEDNIDDLYSTNGLYEVFKKGILNAPYLWECRTEFAEAVKYKTLLINGAVILVDEFNTPIDIVKKIKESFNNEF